MYKPRTNTNLPSTIRVCMCAGRLLINSYQIHDEYWDNSQLRQLCDHPQQQRARSPVIVDDEEGHLIYKNGDSLADRCS